MGSELKRLKRRKEVVEKMEALADKADTTLVIHYSCESFYDKTDGKTPRVTSIGVRNLFSAQTDSFSVHQVAERKGIPFDQISNHYDDLEHQMLTEYFEYVRTHPHCSFIHWNMRDVNYGFAAIEHRFRVLGGTPIPVAEDRKFDLSRALVTLYGLGYIGHPRLETLIEKNKISAKDFLTGKEEADAWDNKEFVKLHRSTLRKLDTLANIFERTSSKSIKTNSNFFQQYGFTPAVLGEWMKEHWVFPVLAALGVTMTFVLRGCDVIEKFF